MQQILVNDISPYDIAYLAGLFDGEGCVRLAVINRGKEQKRGQNRSVYLGVEIGNTYEPILHWLKDNFGGHVYKVKRSNLKYSQMWSWHLHGDSLKLLISLILPYSRIKKEELSLLLIAVNMKRGPSNKMHPESYYDKIEELAENVLQAREANHQKQV